MWSAGWKADRGVEKNDVCSKSLVSSSDQKCVTLFQYFFLCSLFTYFFLILHLSIFTFFLHSIPVMIALVHLEVIPL